MASTKKKDKAAAKAAAAGGASGAAPAAPAAGGRVGVDRPALFIGLDGPVADKKSKFRVNDAVCAELAKVTGPIAVITVAGLYRTGKSFILNQLAGGQAGFDIGGSVEPCTEGLWLWIVEKGKLDPAIAPKDMTVVLLDTEGLGSFQKTSSHDVKIFALAVLLSSYFIYNSLGTIDDNAMDKLSLVVELTRYIRSKADEDNKEPILMGQDPGALAMYFPKFTWLVRDFSLELLSAGKVISADEYLEQALEPLDGDPDDVGGKNAIRTAVTQAFRDRSCFTLVRPVNDEEKLQNLQDAAPSDFRPEYLQQVRRFVEYVYSRVPAKRLYGYTLNGSMTVDLARAYVTAINTGAVPTIASAWESVVRIEGVKALETAKGNYERAMVEGVESKGGVLDSDELTTLHLHARQAAVAVYRKLAIGGYQKEFDDELEQHVTSYFDKLVVDNLTRSTDHCRALLSSLVQRLNADVKIKKITSFDQLQVAWRTLTAEYKKSARGPATYVEFFRISESLFDPARLVMEGEIEEAEEKLEKKMEGERERAKKEYQRLDKLFQEVDTEWKKSQEDARKAKDENKQLTADVARLEKSLREANILTKENQPRPRGLLAASGLAKSACRPAAGAAPSCR